MLFSFENNFNSGLSSNILKTNCSADELKSDIYALEEKSGCKVETSNEFAVTGCFDEKVIVCDEYQSSLARNLMDTINGPLTFFQDRINMMIRKL